MGATANENATESSLPTNKTLAATGGSVVGGAIATILIYILKTKYTVDLPIDVQGAITTVTTGAFTFLTGYYFPHGASEAILKTTDNRIVSGR